MASVLGLIIQPLFGKLLQNTQTKYGKYKPFILLMAPIFAAFAIAATWSPDGIRVLEFNATPKIIYAYCICTPTLMMWNLFQNTFYMMPGVITPNQQERTDIWSPIGFAFFEPRDYRGVSFHKVNYTFKCNTLRTKKEVHMNLLYN